MAKAPFNDPQPKVLLAAALAARRRACAPYSRFKVGAALLTRGGRIVTGANIESASYGLTCCAERVALFKALSDGYADFIALAVVARAEGGPMPCGACRQLLAEYAPQARVMVADTRAPAKAKVFSVGQLLPSPFTKPGQRPGKTRADLEREATEASPVGKPKVDFAALLRALKTR
jgi:cytidine deaminase